MPVKTAPYTNRTLGADAIIQVPVDLENLVAASCGADVHHAAVKHSLYQGWNNKFRKALVAKLVEHTSVAIPSTGKTKVTRKGDTVEILISEGDYIKFLLNNNHISETDYRVLHQQVAETVPFEVSKKEEDSEPDAKFFALAQKILGMVEAGTTGSDGQPITEDSFISKWSAVNPGYNFENLGGFTEEGIARALEIDEKRRALEINTALL